MDGSELFLRIGVHFINVPKHAARNLTRLPQIRSSISSGLNRYLSGDSLVTIWKPLLNALNCFSTLLFSMYSAYCATNSCTKNTSVGNERLRPSDFLLGDFGGWSCLGCHLYRRRYNHMTQDTDLTEVLTETTVDYSMCCPFFRSNVTPLLTITHALSNPNSDQ